MKIVKNKCIKYIQEKWTWKFLFEVFSESQISTSVLIVSNVFGNSQQTVFKNYASCSMNVHDT